jgi:hypothetical protein
MVCSQAFLVMLSAYELEREQNMRRNADGANASNLTLSKKGI